jgi:hypothetical protein
VSDEHGPAAFVQIALGERERLVDPQAGAPEHDDQSAQAIAVSGLAGFAHHGDDLLDPRRIGRVADPLVSRRAPGVVAGHRRRRAPTSRPVEILECGHGPSLVEQR